MTPNPPAAGERAVVDSCSDDISADMADDADGLTEQEQQNTNENPEMEALLAKFSTEIRTLKETVAELKEQKNRDISARPKLGNSIPTMAESADFSEPSMSPPSHTSIREAEPDTTSKKGTMTPNPPAAGERADVDSCSDDISADMADNAEDGLTEQGQQNTRENPEMEALLAKFSTEISAEFSNEIRTLKESVAELEAQKNRDISVPSNLGNSIPTMAESADFSEPSPARRISLFGSLVSSPSRYFNGFLGGLFNENEDEETDQQIHEDTYSFILLSPLCGYSFVVGVCVFLTQQAMFMLMLWSLTDYEQMGYGIPVNVNMGVRLGQIFALVFVVIMQTDIIKGLDLVRLIKNESFHKAVPDLKTWRIPLCIATLLLEGSVGILVSFMLVVTSSTVIDLLLNFTAMAFVSELDEAVFFATRYGFFGLQCETDTEMVQKVTYKIHKKAARKAEIVLLFLMFCALFSGWIAVLHRQNQGWYQCSSIMVQFGDEVVPALGTFSGIYDEDSSVSGTAFISRRVRYVERASKRAKFGYCDELQAWTFHWQDETSDTDDFLERDPCSNWKARSTTTATFDLADTLTSSWYIQDEYQREVALDLFHLECYDCHLEYGTSLECSGRGYCSETTALCTCDSEDEGWIGPRCEFPEPCETLAFDVRFGTFPSHRGWSDTLDILRDNESRPVMLHHKPIYAKENSRGTIDLIFFTGRRWAGTHSGLLVDFSTNVADTKYSKANLIGYLQNDFHPHWSVYTLEFLSTPMDIGTPTDAGTPTDLLWSFAERKADDFVNVTGIQAASTTGNLDVILICSICDNHTSPCRFNGECNGDGSCTCSPGSVGKMCEDPPLGNGHCDPWFNTDEFNLDGGDCCDSTCTSSEEYFCGVQDHVSQETWSSAEYPFCELPADEWKLNHAPIVGREGSFSGSIIALSGLGNVMAIASGQFQLKIDIYRKDGANWKLQNVIALPSFSDVDNVRIVSLEIHDIAHNFRPSPRLPFPVHVAIVTQSQEPENSLHMYTCGLGGDWDRLCSKEYEDDGFQFFRSSHGVTNFTVSLEDQTEASYKVCFSLSDDDCRRGDFYKAGTEELDWRISDYGAAVVGLSWNPSDSALQVHTYAWNGTSFEATSVFHIENGTNTSSLALSSDGTVLAVNVCGPVSKLHVFAWDGQVWQNRRFADHQDRVYGGHCYKNQPSTPELSRNGNTVAFLQQVVTDDGIVADDLLQPVVFEWTGLSWDLIGQLDAAPINTGFSLSGNGLVIAMGFPSSGQQQSGEVLVFSRPGGNSRACSENGTSSLRLSISAHDKHHDYHFYLVNQESGLIVMSGSPDRSKWLQDTCVTTSSCHALYVFDDGSFKVGSVSGLLGSGKFELLLDGEKILEEDNGFERFTIMNTFGKTCSASNALPSGSSNKTCPVGSSLLQLILIIDNPADLEWRVHNNSTDTDIMQGGPYPATKILIDQNSCVDDSNECIVVSMKSAWNGNKVRVYLDGSIIESPTIDDIAESIYHIGDCDPIPTMPPFDPSVDDPDWPGPYPTPINATNVIAFNLRTDEYPEETLWEWSMWNYATGGWDLVEESSFFEDANTLFPREFIVENGATYLLTITDTIGDGNCCSYGNGWFTLLSAAAMDDGTSGTRIWSETGNLFSIAIGVFVQVDEEGYAHLVYWESDDMPT